MRCQSTKIGSPEIAGFVPMFELRVWIACLAIIAAIVMAEAQGLGFFGVLWMFIKAHRILSSIAGFVVLLPFLAGISEALGGAFDSMRGRGDQGG